MSNQPAGEVLKPGGVKFDEAALPCPICGLQPRKVEHRQKGGKVRSVGLRCAGMGTHQVEVTAATEEDARAKWNTRPLPQGERAVADGGDGNFFGQDCPEGKVQIEFVGVSPSLRHSEYGWKPSDSAFLEVYVDGARYRIDVGTYDSAHGKRRGLHVIGPFNMQIDKHSVNAFDVYRAPAPPTQEDGR